MRQDHCEACGRFHPLDRAHIKSKGSGGSMGPDNLLALCRVCHQAQHRWGWAKFVEEFPRVARELERRGWEIREELGVMRLRRK